MFKEKCSIYPDFGDAPCIINESLIENWNERIQLNIIQLTRVSMIRTIANISISTKHGNVNKEKSITISLWASLMGFLQ